MGNKWVVTVWGQWDAEHSDKYSHREFYRGESMLGALWAFWRHRNAGTGCVTLEYRR